MKSPSLPIIFMILLAFFTAASHPTRANGTISPEIICRGLKEQGSPHALYEFCLTYQTNLEGWKDGDPEFKADIDGMSTIEPPLLASYNNTKKNTDPAMPTECKLTNNATLDYIFETIQICLDNQVGPPEIQYNKNYNADDKLLELYYRIHVVCQGGPQDVMYLYEIKTPLQNDSSNPESDTLSSYYQNAVSPNDIDRQLSRATNDDVHLCVRDFLSHLGNITYN